MFGLMRPKRQCSAHQAENATYILHRQHYCGTCKAIGQTFDHKSRLMLNFDTVFLAELLSELDQSTPTQWEERLQRINTCFSMPQDTELPFSLHYAANASVLLGALKVDDNIKDHGGLGWRLLKQVYKGSFQKAYQQLSEWGLNTDTVEHWIHLQAEREHTATIDADLDTHLAHYAEATSQITAELFALSGTLLEQDEAQQAAMRQLGFTFGKLMYILDAFEDYEHDVFKQQFNPLAVYWNYSRSLPDAALEEVRTLLLALEQQMRAAIKVLAISAAAKERFSARLSSNLALRLYKERTIPKTLRERLALRWEFAKTTANQILCPPSSVLRQLNYYMIALAVFVNPNTQSYLPNDGKWEVFKWGAFFTATLASIGFVRVVRERKSKKEQRKERRAAKKAKRKRKRFTKRVLDRLSKIASRKNGCWSDCFSACCESCCDGCCESCCDSCMEDDDFWIAFLIVMAAIVLIAGLVILILFLAGVI